MTDTKIDIIESVVCSEYNIKISDLHIKTRRAEISKPRQICIYFLTTLLKYRTMLVGFHYNMGHSNVVQTRARITNKLKNPVFKKKMDNIEQVIRALTNEKYIIPEYTSDEIEEASDYDELYIMSNAILADLIQSGTRDKIDVVRSKIRKLIPVVKLIEAKYDDLKAEEILIK